MGFTLEIRVVTTSPLFIKPWSNVDLSKTMCITLEGSHVRSANGSASGSKLLTVTHSHSTAKDFIRGSRMFCQRGSNVFFFFVVDEGRGSKYHFERDIVGPPAKRR